ncbi:MAG TPA: C-terminal helicase domain-containing protein, partial [Rhizomicrobium sp.]
APIHGDLDQSVRTKTLDKFRAGELKILVASDVAARGLDVPSVSHIFNFDVPIHADDYVHRIGRTGRAGRSGQAFTLASPRDAKYVEFIEKLTGNKLNRRQMTDIEVRDDRSPRRDQHKGRDRDRDRRGGKRHDRRPPDGKFHDQVAGTEPAREAVATSAPNPAILDAPLPEHRPEHKPEHRHEHKPKHRSEPHQGHRQPHEKKPHGKPQRQGAPEKEPVDKSQLPAFLFRKVKLPQD